MFGQIRERNNKIDKVVNFGYTYWAFNKFLFFFIEKKCYLIHKLTFVEVTTAYIVVIN